MTDFNNFPNNENILVPGELSGTPPAKSNRTLWIAVIVILVLLLLCCCCIAILAPLGLFQYSFQGAGLEDFINQFGY